MEPYILKKALISYKKNLETIPTIENKILLIEEKLYEPNTTSLVKVSANKSSSNKDRGKIIIEAIQQLHLLQDQLNHLYYEIDLVDDFISILEGTYKNLVIDKYINRLLTSTLEEMYCYSRNGIIAIVNRLVEEYINNKK